MKLEAKLTAILDGMKGKTMSKFTITRECREAIFSYLRAATATVLTVLLAGETDPKAVLGAVAAAFVPPVIRWLNPDDKAFGRK